MTPPVRFEIDTSKMREALRLAQKWSTQAGPLLLARTAYYIVKDTIELTPFSTPEQIDTDMQTAVMLRRKAKGIGFRTAVRTKKYAGGQSKQGPIGPGGWSVPLAVAIIQGNVMFPKYQSGTGGYKYRPTGQGNANTPQHNLRYARVSSPFANKSRAAGREAMRQTVHRMIAARRSSTKFLVQGWYEVKRILYQIVGKAKQGSWSMGDVESDTSKRSKGFGRVDSSTEGYLMWLEIANIIGTVAGKRGINAAKYNAALHKYGGPALQRAFDTKATEMFIRYGIREMEEGLVPAWNAV